MTEARPAAGTEREMLHEPDERKLGERIPFESSRQATYEDSVSPENEWDENERDYRDHRDYKESD